MLDLLGLLANMTSLLLWIPQARTTYKNRFDKEALRGVSYGTQIIASINTVLWCIYGVWIHSIWLAMGTVIILPLAIWTIWLKYSADNTELLEEKHRSIADNNKLVESDYVNYFYLYMGNKFLCDHQGQRTMQYLGSMDEISSELRETLDFIENAIELAELLVSDSAAEGVFNYWGNQVGKTTNVIVKAGNLNEWGQREYVDPNILIESPSEPNYADQKLGQSSGDAILSNRLQIVDIPQKYRNCDAYMLSFRCARGQSAKRYVEICHLLLEDIQNLIEDSAMTKREGRSLLANSLINGYDYFEDKEALDNFITEQEEALGSTIGLFRDPNYSAEEFNKNVNNHSKDVIDLVYTSKEDLKTLNYIGRKIRSFQKRGVGFAIINNSKHLKRPQKAYDYLVEHADEWRGSPEVLDIVIADMRVGIFFERR